MTPFLQGLAGELVKHAGALGAIGRVVKKHPLLALNAPLLAASTVSGAVEGARSGLHAGEAGKYLRASKAGPSEAFHTNYHPMFEHKMSPAEKTRLSENYSEKTFKR